MLTVYRIFHNARKCYQFRMMLVPPRYIINELSDNPIRLDSDIFSTFTCQDNRDISGAQIKDQSPGTPKDSRGLQCFKEFTQMICYQHMHPQLQGSQIAITKRFPNVEVNYQS
jgi:hypothetical protein